MRAVSTNHRISIEKVRINRPMKNLKVKKQRNAPTSQKEDGDFINDDDKQKYDHPNSSVDNVILTVHEGSLKVLLVKRGRAPFKGQWALVGGFVDLKNDTSLEETALRKLREKTGVNAPYLEQLITIGNSRRDPRGWSITTVYFSLLPSENLELKGGDGIEEIGWFKIEGNGTPQKLAFDHSHILSIAIQRLRSKGFYTSLPAYLLQGSFTLSELKEVYELVLDKALDAKAFRRRMLTSPILIETDEFKRESKRPARLYRLNTQRGPFIFSRAIEDSEREVTIPVIT